MNEKIQLITTIDELNDILYNSIQSYNNFNIKFSSNPEYAWAFNHQDYTNFFASFFESQVTTFIINAYKLYEIKDTTYNFRNLKNTLKSNESLITENKLNDIDKNFTLAFEHWKKINRLRNNIFGHRSVKDITKLLNNLNLTHECIQEFFDCSVNIINITSKSVLNRTYDYNIDSSQQTKKVIELIIEKENIKSLAKKRHLLKFNGSNSVKDLSGFIEQ